MHRVVGRSSKFFVLLCSSLVVCFSRGLFSSQRTSQRVKVIRSLMREVCGLNPFEKRMVDVLKVGAGNPDKKIYKIAKGKVSRSCRCRRGFGLAVDVPSRCLAAVGVGGVVVVVGWLHVCSCWRC
jgi:hypothetical protein